MKNELSIPALFGERNNAVVIQGQIFSIRLDGEKCPMINTCLDDLIAVDHDVHHFVHDLSMFLGVLVCPKHL